MGPLAIYILVRGSIGADEENEHCLGNLDNGFFSGKICNEISNVAINKECQVCGLKDYCMNPCGCTNYHSTGNYNIVSPFVCASEKASINTAFNVFQSLRHWVRFITPFVRNTIDECNFWELQRTQEQLMPSKVVRYCLPLTLGLRSRQINIWI